MDIAYSKTGQLLAQGSGIGELMDDLGDALSRGAGEIHMLGGGQPALIPEVDALWRKRMDEIVGDPATLQKMLSIYDGPAGGDTFRHEFSALLQREFGWPLTGENIGITPGGQCAFFLLFNLLAGEMPDGSQRQIILPLMPEYIGYADQGIRPGLFHADKPIIEEIGDREFKYHIDFPALEAAIQDHPPGALCVSRPTNPSGNVLTDDEISRLQELAQQHQVPLIIDNAYGAPFPGILFKDATPTWDQNTILTLSLSKLGLPGTRTGIVIASPEIIRALSNMTAIIGLANNNIGQAIITPLLRSGEILQLSRDTIQPYYAQKSQEAQAIFHQELPADIPWRMHASEGALFLWLWFPGLPITSKQLYDRLKKRGTLVIPGDYFFYGLEDQAWPHQHECIRVSYAMDHATVQAGARAIAEEVKAAFA